MVRSRPLLVGCDGRSQSVASQPAAAMQRSHIAGRFRALLDCNPFISGQGHASLVGVCVISILPLRDRLVAVFWKKPMAVKKQGDSSRRQMK